MAIPLSTTCDANAGFAGISTVYTDGVEGVAEDKTCRTDALILLIHRHVWQPARYAHPDWFALIGFHRRERWCYGEYPALDRSLNRVLRARHCVATLPGRLNERQRRLVSLASNISRYALALGLLALGCSDYFLLPDYRHALRDWLDSDLLWRLFGMCDNTQPARFSPENVINTANRIGIAMLYRAARHEPVLHALLIRLPLPTHALYPVVPLATMNLVERMLCR